MRAPSSCGRREGAAWGVATVIAAALCVALVPLLPALWLGGRWGRGADS